MGGINLLIKTENVKRKTYRKIIYGILSLSLVANIYLYKEIYVAKKADTNVALGHYYMWQNRLQEYTVNLGKFLESGDNESYYTLLAGAEFIRTFKTVPGDSYFGRKNMGELSSVLIKLTNQIHRNGEFNA